MCETAVVHAASTNAVQQSISRTVCDVESMDFNIRLTVESATTRPGFRSAAKLLLRERSESWLVCALRKIRACL